MKHSPRAISSVSFENKICRKSITLFTFLSLFFFFQRREGRRKQARSRSTIVPLPNLTGPVFVNSSIETRVTKDAPINFSLPLIKEQ